MRQLEDYERIVTRVYGRVTNYISARHSSKPPGTYSTDLSLTMLEDE